MCLLRINLPNLCPNIIHIHASDFNACHSEVSFDAQCMMICLKHIHFCSPMYSFSDDFLFELEML